MLENMKLKDRNRTDELTPVKIKLISREKGRKKKNVVVKDEIWISNERIKQEGWMETNEVMGRLGVRVR